jgi:hypothetical protein
MPFEQSIIVCGTKDKKRQKGKKNRQCSEKGMVNFLKSVRAYHHLLTKKRLEYMQKNDIALSLTRIRSARANQSRRPAWS